MDLRNLKNFGTFAAGLALAVSLAPVAAAAQDRPSYATHDEDTVHGRIVSVNGYDVSVRDDKGYVDHVKLHQGTIINPTGLSLAPGLSVTILGFNEGTTLAANEIDTAYTLTPSYAYGPPVYPAYYGYPYYGYPYGYYGYPYRYGYFGYPSIAIGFSFGGYRGFYGHGFYGRGIYGARFR
jgi:hypothetical protein